MFRKILICAAMIAALVISGCGEEKIIGTPDKAILAYAEIVMTGDTANLSAAGFSEEDKNSIRQAVTSVFIGTLENVTPLSDAATQELAQMYFDKLKGNVTFAATVKSAGDEPVVALTTTPIDSATSAKTAAANNDELIALIGMVGKLKADGATDDNLKNNPDVQNLAVKAFSKYIASISLKPEETFDIPCKKVTGADGNAHWMPAEGKMLIDFLIGQK